ERGGGGARRPADHGRVPRLDDAAAAARSNETGGGAHPHGRAAPWYPGENVAPYLRGAGPLPARLSQHQGRVPHRTSAPRIANALLLRFEVVFDHRSPPEKR